MRVNSVITIIFVTSTFFLNNLNFKDKNSAAYKQCVGEAYYFRAWFYFQLFKNYGKIAWVNRPLEPQEEEMNQPQQERTVIADSILADLDKAIANLNTQNSSASMRVHKDVHVLSRARWHSMRLHGRGIIRQRTMLSTTQLLPMRRLSLT